MKPKYQNITACLLRAPCFFDNQRALAQEKAPMPKLILGEKHMVAEEFI
jgi:hypothetical protein